MTLWDIFYSERLEARKGLTTDEVRAKLNQGDLGNADLIRPSGTGVSWSRISDWSAPSNAPGEPEPAPLPEETQPPAEPTEPWVEPLPQSGSHDRIAGEFSPILSAERDNEFAPPSHDELEAAETGDALMRLPHAEEPLDAIIDDEDDEIGEFDLNLQRNATSAIALPAVASGTELWAEFVDEDEDNDQYDPETEDEAAAEFTLARNSAETVEELDLAAMVDVAFQLVLFFLVTATTVLYKTLEVPKPNPEAPPSVASQGAQSIEDLQDTYILVNIDAAGNFQIDREPAPNTMKGLAERLRAARTATQRTAMLLTADFSTQHQHAVTAYDAANEIGLRIAIARPVPKPEE
jgi:biopolymer transport protein ExbD